jgi:hypothetical protein
MAFMVPVPHQLAVPDRHSAEVLSESSRDPHRERVLCGPASKPKEVRSGMQWCIDIVSGIGWGSSLLMIGVIGFFWLVAVFGMAVLFGVSRHDRRRR